MINIRKYMNAAIIATVVLITLGAYAKPNAAPKAHKGELKPKAACSSLSGLKIPASSIGLPTSGATISRAELKPATVPNDRPLDAVPEYCEANGVISPVDSKAPDINFQVVIPTVWNGMSIQIGGNQGDGFIPLLAALARDNAGSPLGPVMPPDAPFPIAKGYALYGSDSGHCCANRPGRRGPGRGPIGANSAQVGNLPANFGPATPDWMSNDEAYTNYAYAQIKKTHDAAMAVILQMYGVRPRINYFGGESQGGRESLTAATRFPEDYDGVVASVPLVNIMGLRFMRANRLIHEAMPGGWIPPAKIPAIAKEVLRQCDSLDGLEDGVINDYVGCNRLFDPSTHPKAFDQIRCAGGGDTGNDCLSDAQIATANAFHGPFDFTFPLRTTGEELFPGAAAGGEEGKEQFNRWIISTKQPDAASLTAASQEFRTLLHDPNFNIAAMNLAADKGAILQESDLLGVKADLSKFFAKGGKVIMHSSASDTVQNPRAEMQFFEVLVKRNGKQAVDRYMRYYVTPNADHSSVGFAYGNKDELPRQSDLLSYLENWVENGAAPPEPIVETLKDVDPPYTLLRSRPLCRYPNYPRYQGKGDPKVASSYGCSAP